MLQLEKPKQLSFSKGTVDFIKSIFMRQTSTFLTVLGRRETGKTNLAFAILEVLYHCLGFTEFSTNVAVTDDAGYNIIPISNLEALKAWCESNTRKKLFIFDEIGRSMPRRSPMSRLNLKLINEFQVLRKYKLSILACTINEKYVDNNALGDDILDGSFEKPYRYRNMKLNQKFALYHDLLFNEEIEVENIPKSTVQFDTWSTAVFTESGPVTKPMFKDGDLSLMWDWCRGKTASELGVSRMKIHRITKKMIREYLDSKSNK